MCTQVCNNCCGSNLTQGVNVSFVAILPVTGVEGMLYVDTTINRLFRWNGTSFIQLS